MKHSEEDEDEHSVTKLRKFYEIKAQESSK